MAQHRKFVVDDVVVVPPPGELEGVVANRPFRVTEVFEFPGRTTLHIVPVEPWPEYRERRVWDAVARLVAA